MNKGSMTTNHPAHGPVSLDRLHQIREILSKAAAQSDGGNLGYAMADAVKVIAGAIAAIGAEPVGYFYADKPGDWYQISDGDRVPSHRRIPLYSNPQSSPVVKLPNEFISSEGIVVQIEKLMAVLAVHGIQYERKGNACRAAMIQAGNSPVTPDCWIPVSERMPERDVDVQVYCADKKEQMVGYMERNETEGWFRFASLPNGGGVYCKPTHWMPLPAEPKQEVKL
ncbi:DUF551 domain-containing protein [Citrobacter freundii]|nr:DUF551 domain-containing protein [Citrobacter freundii]MCX3155581.1 DUF551 domain-containing protein [Citrobacter freundii]MCX3160007.1 DUF551 domain-containing protein [Citrobacter freundii]MDH2704614.1 DUF551 domain-containing protein [Citrobacter freundii]